MIGQERPSWGTEGKSASVDAEQSVDGRGWEVKPGCAANRVDAQISLFGSERKFLLPALCVAEAPA